jgi:hypothetical protein
LGGGGSAQASDVSFAFKATKSDRMRHFLQFLSICRLSTRIVAMDAIPGNDGSMTELARGGESKLWRCVFMGMGGTGIRDRAGAGFGLSSLSKTDTGWSDDGEPAGEVHLNQSR